MDDVMLYDKNICREELCINVSWIVISFHTRKIIISI